MKKFLILILSVLMLCACGNRQAVNTEEVYDFAEETAYPAVMESTSPLPQDTISPAPTTSPTEKPIKKQTPVPAVNTDSPPQSKEIPVSTIKISITGVDDNMNIFPLTEVGFEEGQTVFDVLLSITKERKIQMEYSGKKKTAYIKGINNLYEFDKGGSSGWIYSVNGEFPNKSCGAYLVKSGDIIEFKYKTN